MNVLTVVPCLALAIACTGPTLKRDDAVDGPRATTAEFGSTGHDSSVDAATTDVFPVSDDPAAPGAGDAVQNAASSPGPADAQVPLPAHDGQTAVPRVDLLLTGARLAEGQMVDIGILGRDIAFVRPAGSVAVQADESISAEGRWVVPAFIDSHVHLAYLPVADALADGGVAAAVDLASPPAFLTRDHGPLRVIASGPMITAPSGYPTRSWGADGYGIECDGPNCGIAAVDRLQQAGARLIKVPLGMQPQLSAETVQGIVRRAHALELPVVAHALSNAAAQEAGRLGIDVLAHTPVETMDDAAIDVWRSRTVVSTLAAFGGRDTTVGNLGALYRLGATVLYGTDLGNTSTAGIQEREIRLLMDAGLDGRAIVASGTSNPAEFWGLTRFGRIAPGAAAGLLILDENPYLSPLTLARPHRVIIQGRTRGPSGSP